MLGGPKKKIETIIFNSTPFKGWYFITDGLAPKEVGGNFFEINKGDNYNLINKLKEQAVIPYKGQGYIVPWYLKEKIDYDTHQHKKIASFFKDRLRKHLINGYRWFQDKEHYWQHTFFNFVGADTLFSKVYYKFILRKYKRNLRASYEKNTITSEQLSKIKRFIFVPLHYQPEATTAPRGGLYSDQIYMIEKLRKVFPDDIALVVKEHYSQYRGMNTGFAGRYLGYWNKIADIHNTYVVSLDMNSKDLILSSMAVATVTGTAGWEAIQYGRHCIIFGSAWYESHPSVIKFGEADFDNKISDVINGIRPVDETERFFKNFGRSLINNEIHGLYVKDEESIRSTDQIVSIVQEFCKKKCN
ncbi:MAG: hypothetical protein D3913_00655 [Candidatus Electrothrix sp. LOE1_4_5]|nr:hypothetical protein [Candidatus Electrothrix gigas]